MIRFRLKEMQAEKGFKENRRVTLDEVSTATGVHRTTLSKIANQRGYNTGTDQVDRLCAYFECRVEDIIEHVPLPEQPE